MLKPIKLTIIFLLALFSVCIFSVFLGVKVNSISFGNFSVTQLYLKLDKKLILEVDEINILFNKSDTTNSSDDIIENLKKFPYILDFFQKIEIKNLKIKDNHFTVSFDQKHLYLDNKFLNVSAKMNYSEPKVDLDIYSLRFKDIDLTLLGKSKIDLDKKVMTFFGDFILKDKLDGEINLKIDENFLDFYINSKNSIKSIAFLKDYFRLDKTAEEWMYDNVKGDIKLTYLKGRIDIPKRQAILDSIEGNVKITDAKIRFEKGLDTVNTKLLDINYKNDTLSFDLKNPTYNKSKLYGSRVYINHLTSLEKGVVVVDLKSKSRLNDDILGILNAYDIKLPLKQLSGSTNSKLVLSIPYKESKKMSVNGIFKVKDAKLMLEDFEIYTPSSVVTLKDSIVKVQKSKALHKDMIDALIELTINTSNSTSYGSAHINRFLIKTNENEKIIDIKDFATSLAINFKNEPKISLEQLNTDIAILKDKIQVGIHDIKVANKYSDILKQLNLDSGDLLLNIKNSDNIDFKANLKNLDLPIYKNSKPLSSLSINGKIDKNKTIIKSIDNSLVLDIQGNKKTLNLTNLDLNLKSQGKSDNLDLPSFKINLKNSVVYLDENTDFKAKWGKVDINGKRIDFEALVQDLDLPIQKDAKKITQFHFKGFYVDNKVDVFSMDERLKINYDTLEDKLEIRINAYDLSFNTKKEQDNNSNTSYNIIGTNSNIIINDKYTAKANSFKITLTKHTKFLNINYKDTAFNFKQDPNGNLKLEASKMSDEFVNTLLNKNLISGGEINLNASGKAGILNGKATIKDSTIKDLAILNNLLIFINTSPALINPFLAVPSVVGMASNGGFNLAGYKIVSGDLNFMYNDENKFLNIYELHTKGNGIDFDGYFTANFNDDKINSKLKLIFFKDYSKIVGAIPVVNYILLGDERQVSTQIDIYGTLSEPVFKTNLTKDGVKAPVNVIKRIITSPVKLFEGIMGTFSSDEEK